MKWKTKTYEDCDRWVKRFAWFPVRFDDGYTVRFEQYEVKQFRGAAYGHWHDHNSGTTSGPTRRRIERAAY